MKGTGIVVEQRHNLLIFHFNYKFPITFKPRHIKIGEVNYAKVSSKLLSAVKNKASILNAKVISDIAPLLEAQKEKEALLAKQNSINTYLKP